MTFEHEKNGIVRKERHFVKEQAQKEDSKKTLSCSSIMLYGK